jgi:tetratricopeptide (TPR) repeat protein
MTVRFRKSVKILPGVRINFNKNSTSLSLGPRGAHYTMSSTGRRTVSAGIPGTGIYAYETVRPSTSARRSAVQKATPQDLQSFPQPTPKPTLFSSRAERAFSTFLNDIYDPNNKYSVHEKVEKAKALRDQYAALAYPLNVLTFLHILNEDEYEEKLIEMGSKIWGARDPIFGDRILVKYARGIHPTVRICDGISATEILDKEQFGFVWVEVLQAHEKYDDALTVLHEMDANQLTAISMADIELSMKDYDAVLETTSDIANEDDATLILLVLRGVAFREQGLFDASLECMKLALAKRSRSVEALHRAHYERALTYEKMRKIPQARKDLEMILIDDPTNQEVKDRLKELTSSEK